MTTADSQFFGNLGNSTGADAKCMADANYPGSGTFKALIGTSSRQPGLSDWVLEPNTAYYLRDNVTFVGSTDGSEWFNSPLSVAINDSSSFRYVLTGLDGSDGSLYVDNCVDFTVGDNSQYYVGGYADYTPLSWAFGGEISSSACGSDQGYIYCVEQP